MWGSTLYLDYTHNIEINVAQKFTFKEKLRYITTCKYIESIVHSPVKHTYLSHRYIKIQFYSIYWLVCSPLLGKDICTLAIFKRHSDRAKEVSLSALNSTVTPATEINHKKRYSFLICCKQSQSVSSPVKFKLLSRGTLSALGATNTDQYCLARVDSSAAQAAESWCARESTTVDKMDEPPWLPFGA